MSRATLAPGLRNRVKPACYGIRDLAVLLGVSERTIRRLGEQGAIPGRLPIRTVRWSRQVVDNWLLAAGR
jgi:excisionase family DNA binding protein